MRKENLTRLYVDNYNDSLNNREYGKRNNCTISPKAEYGSMSEAVAEFQNNMSAIRANVAKMLNLDPSKYDLQGPDDGDKYVIISPSVDMGDGYAAYIGKLWPKRKNDLAAIIIKQFRLHGSKGQYTVGTISPKNINGICLAVFPEDFLQEMANSLGTDMRTFFFLSCHYGLISTNGNEVRWLFDEGMATG